MDFSHRSHGFAHVFCDLDILDNRFFFPREKVSRKDLVILLFGALFGLVGAQLSFATALKYTSPVNISLIAAMTPVVVMLMAAIWLKEPITFKKAAGVAAGVAGALLLIFHSSGAAKGPNEMLGNLLSVINIITYGIYLIITRSVSLRYSPITLMKWMFLFQPFFSPSRMAGFRHSQSILRNGHLERIRSNQLYCLHRYRISLFPCPHGFKTNTPDNCQYVQ